MSNTTPLPFLNVTQEDISRMNPVNVECTILMEVTTINPRVKDGKTSLVVTFTCTDQNSPQYGKPAFRSYPLAYPGMMLPLYCAAMCVDPEEVAAGALDINPLIGKTVYVQHKLQADGKGGMSVQASNFFRVDRPPLF